MKNGFTLVIASLLFAICYGMLKIKSAKNELADSLVRVLGVAIATSISFTLGSGCNTIISDLAFFNLSVVSMQLSFSRS